ncbi:MAG: hypothetical protein QM673_06280, partial [Gordonia sp. (in: high G+C Gram-positive bacteria)]
MVETLHALPDRPSLWVGLDMEALTGVAPNDLDDTPINDLLIGAWDIDRGRSYLAWTQYRVVAQLAARLVSSSAGRGSGVDGFADLAKRIARTRGLTQ